MTEAIIDPDLPIIDPHHHLWDRRPVMHLIPPPVHGFDHISFRKGHYLLDQLLEDTGSGHNIVATVYLECRSMYRADGPNEMKPVGETEFVNGVAAMAASGLYGKTLACAGIVSTAELLMGADVGRVLDAHAAAGGARFKGIRRSTSFDADPDVLGPLARNPAGVLMEPKFREGFAELGKRGPVVRCVDDGAATAGADRSGATIPGDADRAGSRRHAAGRGQLQGPPA